ncbi:MAG: cobalamin-binding protein [Bryobacteraceae bacterium]
MRIVPLIASATEIVHALGLGEFQVGRSHECDYPLSVSSLPVCTRPRFDIEGDSREIDQRVKETLRDAESVYEVFDDVLDRLQPTHILTQTQCKVCAVSLDDVERALGSRYSTRPQVVALEPNSLGDIWKDIRRVADACGVQDRGTELIADSKRRMLEISEKAHATGLAPRVVCIEWHQPLMAAGNWVPQLVEMLGARNLCGIAGGHSPWMSWQELSAVNPDVIVSMPCGFDLARTRAELRWLTENTAWPELKAVKDQRAYIADGNQFFNRPGPRVVESLEILAEMLFPDAFPPAHEGGAWERIPANS